MCSCFKYNIFWLEANQRVKFQSFLIWSNAWKFLRCSISVATGMEKSNNLERFTQWFPAFLVGEMTHVYTPVRAEGSRTHQPGSICGFCLPAGSPARRSRRYDSRMFDIFSPEYQRGSLPVSHRWWLCRKCQSEVRGDLRRVLRLQVRSGPNHWAEVL